tara:strand:- start:104 stop:478 length:375 start_codon:yes stop_codon:yes gene_type:complete
MRQLPYFFIFILLTNNVQSQEMPTVKEYKDNKETNKHNQFIYGLENGLEWANDESFRKHGVQIFCKPSDIVLPINETKKLINEQLEIDSAFYLKYHDAPLIGLALKNAYLQNFPCDKLNVNTQQ